MLVRQRLRRGIAAELERGVDLAPARWASRAWRALADPVRFAALPAGADVVGVGGATLGGSGKTPVTGALACALSNKTRVAVAASAYPARPPAARQVRPDDDPRVVGDDPLALSRALDAQRVPVVIGPDRQSALELAGRLAPFVIADGLLQTRPHRLALSVLVLDASAPWGSGACPPAGDLRADPSKLLKAADVVLIGAAAGEERWNVPEGRDALVWHSILQGARTADGEMVDVAALATLRVGVTLAVARPERVLAELGAHCILPVAVRLSVDHGQPTAGRAVQPKLDAWLTTAKCKTKLGRELGGAPVWVLEHRVELPTALIERCMLAQEAESGS